MADWNSPILTTAYATLLTNLKDRDLDAATLFNSAPTNPVDKMIRYNRSTNIFEQYNSGSGLWVALVLAAAGGGTGGVSALGTMAYQNSNAIAVSGGTLSGINSASFSCDITFNNSARAVGSNATKLGKLYVGTGMLIPVGTNAWLTS